VTRHAAAPPGSRALFLAVDLLCAAGAPSLAGCLLGAPWTAGLGLVAAIGALAVLAWPGHVASSHPLRWTRAATTTLAATAASAAGWLSGLLPATAIALTVAVAAGAALLVRMTWRIVAPPSGSRAVLVGPLDCRIRLREHLAAHPETGLLAVAEVGPGSEVMGGLPSFPLGDLERVLAEFEADEVLISTGFDDRLLVMEVMARLLERPLVIRYVPDPEALPLFCPRPADIAGLAAIDLSRGPLSPGAELLKWIEDKAVAIIALSILSLPMLLIAALIRLTSPGPALFVQERHGRGGRAIRVFKFRTMRFDACTQDVTTGKFRQATQGDARITPFGRFLRNTSLDETPQFLNVLLGDMSVVGPRPHPMALNRKFGRDIGELMRRHYVKPGITGLAQVSGARGETRTVEDMRRRVDFDLEYLRNWSLWLDVTIIAKTIFGGWINRQP
jgi:putative colanic acid biosynthesis UDP-glucose lipid carrier transferase